MRSDAPCVDSHADLVTHEKLQRFRDALGISRAEAVGHLTLLWHWCATYSPENGMVPASNRDLADVMHYAGNENALYRALRDSGWLDTTLNTAYCHEWALYFGDRWRADQVSGRRARDGKRLNLLRSHEQQQLPVSIGPESALPEGIQIHRILRGPDAPAMVTTLQRIDHELKRYPGTDGIAVAHSYVAWQLRVAQEYRDRVASRKPHVDTVQGWCHQMGLNAEKGWCQRDTDQTRTPTPMQQVSDEEIERYHRGAKKFR